MTQRASWWECASCLFTRVAVGGRLVASHRVMAARSMRPDGRGEMTADELYDKHAEELIRYATAHAGPPTRRSCAGRSL